MDSIIGRVQSAVQGKQYQYRPLPVVDENGQQQEPRQGKPRETLDTEALQVKNIWARDNRKLLKLSTLAIMFGLALYLVVAFSHAANARKYPTFCDTPDRGYECYPDSSRSWGQYSPFFSVESEAEVAIPATCSLTFAQVLSRHGGRDPTAGKTKSYQATIQRVQKNVEEFVDSSYGRFAFLKNYTYELGADQLTPFGQQQMINSGTHFFQRYKSLVATNGSTGGGRVDRAFVRSAGQDRVVQSGALWVKGFHRARLGLNSTSSSTDNDTAVIEQHMVIIPEDAGYNNTLSYNGLCADFSSSAGSAAQNDFTATFVPAITARLNKGLPGANLTDTETIYFMDLCPFETISNVLDGRRLSPFCHLFSADEWVAYDYYQTLGKWYGFGPGSALGATQGVGYVNELIARLTSTPVNDHTSTNRTLDSNPATFPLNATLYADFSHDNDMANIYAALGLYNSSTNPLAPSNTTRTEPADMLGFAASWTVPFAARMYVEKMVCGDSSEELVRVLVNDRVIPLQNCGADSYGRCTLSRFVDSLAFARQGGNWEKCFA